MLLFDRFNEVITHASIFSTELSGVIRICSTMVKWGIKQLENRYY